MRKGYTEILAIIDESGSMSSLKTDSIGGFREFIMDQRKVEGKCNVSLITFSDSSHTLYDGKDIQEDVLLTEENYHPHGSTALLDAIGRGIGNLGKRLSDMKEEERPEFVIVVILTDGMENASREYTPEMVKNIITEQTDKYNWKFIYLGANQDSFSVAQSYGISAISTHNFNASPDGIRAVYTVASVDTTSYRTGGE